MGPVADAVERAGGSVARVFRRAETPLRLIEHPDQLMLLRDQLALIEFASREVGDEAFPLSLSLHGGIASLGSFGAHVSAAPCLGDAIALCCAGMETALQSATHMSLSRKGGEAKWSYEISDPAVVGRRKNELLAFGYMLALLRRFLGAGAAPSRVESPGPLTEKARLEEMLGCEIALGEKAALFFPDAVLLAENPRPCAAPALVADLPAPNDFVAGVEQLVQLALLERRPSLDRVSRRLGVSSRSLQRRLAAEGVRFEDIRRGVLVARAKILLQRPGRSISQIGLELGYADPAHFSRAAVDWVGLSPRAWRRKLCS